MRAKSVFPLQRGGAAEQMVRLLGQKGNVTVQDLTALPRFGLKGPGSAEWLQATGLILPAVNRHARDKGLTILRLGGNDVTCLEGSGASARIAALRRRWQAATAPKGYASWREESWAWLRVDGPGVGDLMLCLCALDLRLGRFGDGEIAQTRFADIDSVLLRSGQGFEILFDISLTSFVLAGINYACSSIVNRRQA